MTILGAFLVALACTASWVTGWVQGHGHASKFAADVVDRQLGEIRDYRSRRATR